MRRALAAGLAAEGAGDSVRVVGVVSRDRQSQAESVADESRGLFPNAFEAEGELMTKLGLNALPVTYVLDADGEPAHVQTTPIRSVDALRGLVAEHLGVQP